MSITPGLYYHYKNKDVTYEVLCEAEHTETREQLVVYRSIISGRVWCRPSSMFFEEVEYKGQRVPRFTPIETSNTTR